MSIGMIFIVIRNMKPKFYIEGNLEIVKNGHSFLTQKRVALLKWVKQKGSINAASKELKMSYQQAWHFIKEMNEISPLPLVVQQRGGANGGGAVLTKFGEKTINEYEKLCSLHNSFKIENSNELWLCFF
jgi:molybdate transport system regulatory protein